MTTFGLRRFILVSMVSVAGEEVLGHERIVLGDPDEKARSAGSLCDRLHAEYVFCYRASAAVAETVGGGRRKTVFTISSVSMPCR